MCVRVRSKSEWALAGRRWHFVFVAASPSSLDGGKSVCALRCINLTNYRDFLVLLDYNYVCSKGEGGGFVSSWIVLIGTLIPDQMPISQIASVKLLAALEALRTTKDPATTGEDTIYAGRGRAGTCVCGSRQNEKILMLIEPYSLHLNNTLTRLKNVEGRYINRIPRSTWMPWLVAFFCQRRIRFRCINIVRAKLLRIRILLIGLFW